MRRNKSKRGERGSSDNELRANPKRLNMADSNEAAEEATDEEATDEEAFEMEETKENDEEPSLLEIREMLVNIQITVSDIQMKNIQFTEEMAALRSITESQKRDLDATKTTLGVWFSGKQGVKEGTGGSEEKCNEKRRRN